MELKEIGYIKTPFATKFGVPRQSGLCKDLMGTIVFMPEYRNPDFLRGIEGFSHLWIVWGFSEAQRDKISPTVRPPKLGGNTKMGVFATRSPFRPNPIALSCVKLEKVEFDQKLGYTLTVSGIDMMDKSPIYDIKPYLPFADCIIDATNGFCENTDTSPLKIDCPDTISFLFSEKDRSSLFSVLEQDPRPSYIEDENRIYGFEFMGYEIKFRVKDKVLTVVSAEIPK